MDLRQKLMLAGGGAIATLALVGGAVMAQTPDSSPTPAPATPGAQTTPTAPDTAPQPASPGQAADGDCPDKGDGQGTTGLRQSPSSGASQTGRQVVPMARY